MSQINENRDARPETPAVPDKRALALKILKQYSIIALGAVIYSLGISFFIEPAQLSSGGMTGISIIVDTLIRRASPGFPINQGIWLIILNVPMLVLGLVFFGWKFLVSTGFATVGSALLMSLWSLLFGENGMNILPLTEYFNAGIDRGSSMLINAVIGGVLFGAGMGIIFRMGASTAGTDVLVKILRRKFRHIKTGMISLVTDMIIVTGSLFINQDLETLFYTALSVVVFTLTFDFVLYGGNTAKTVFIIAARDMGEALCEKILTEVDTGATIIDAQGAYTREDKAMLMCVVKPYMYPKLRDVVKQVDKTAFMIVSSAKEIYGEGYKDQNEEEV